MIHHITLGFELMASYVKRSLQRRTDESADSYNVGTFPAKPPVGSCFMLSLKCGEFFPGSGFSTDQWLTGSVIGR
jgi:hypothetical protein